MKRIILLLSLLSNIAYAQTKQEQVTAKNTSRDGGFAVCELFTSEGCSSCPPADALLKSLDKEYAEANVYMMEFHVDYWDKLGWKDKYSNPAYTQRQTAYNKVLESQAYTPQMIINGTMQLIGSERNIISAGIEQELKKNKKSLSIECKAIVKNGQAQVTYVADGFNKKDILNVALVQLEDSTLVQAGENKGHKLRHTNIVRQFVSAPISNSFGTVNIDIPAGLKDRGFKLIIYTQNHKSMAITSASALNIDKTAKQTSL